MTGRRVLSWVIPGVVLVACSNGVGDQSAGAGGASVSAASATSTASAASAGGGGSGGASGGAGGDGARGLTCEEACLEAYPEGLEKYAPLYLCLGCSECYGPCGGAADSNCSEAPEVPGACDDAASTCDECIDCAQLPGAACHDEVVACNEVPDCDGLISCFNVCVNGE